ncbi:kinesin-like protein KIFC3 isoform X2 [Hippocampus zosterae]|uniref:kinesin-like protein KIFC3 isoform X2 n=1 Tax=Hippocampus zosterae TaxID=109293 RepID=UPI00223E033F|nr:kinesin-like protein KIFC3 isoform X2 [Hippocampus zosterae]
MSDGEDEASFLRLPGPAFSQHSLPGAELSRSNAAGQRRQLLLIQMLQDKLCDLQARLDRGSDDDDDDDASGGADKERPGTPSPSPPRRPANLAIKAGEATAKAAAPDSMTCACARAEGPEKNPSQQPGATDLEKHLELLELENKSLKRQLAAGGASEGARSQEAEPVGRERPGRRRDNRLADTGKPAADKSAPADAWRRRQDLIDPPSDPSAPHPGLSDRDLWDLWDLARREAPSQTAEEAESGDRLRAQNALLREQVCAQRRTLRELETQLQQSQRTCAQLRTQVALYDGEVARARRQLDGELLLLKEEKERVVHEAFVRAESQMKAVHDNLAGVRSKLAGLHPALRTLTADYNSLKKQVHHFPAMLRDAIDDAKREICRAIGDVSVTNQKLVDKYKREMNLRKKIHNQLVQLKGNIRVLCRVRPVAGGEEAEGVLTFDPDDDGVLHLSDKGKVTTFDLDKVFRPEATQEEVFSEVEALVTSCVDGFHVCIFAYGQTGSGKTYTMEGVASDPGLNQRALRLLFSRVADKSPEWEFHICVSMLEIYNETLRDLLGDQPAADKLDIKMNPDGSGQLYVPGLTRVAVRTIDDVNQVLEAGRASRATACTDLNRRSSRSHALLMVSVAGLNGTTGSRTQGKLNLVDLAGSERVGRSGAEGGRLREARHINKSLSALGDVMDALRRKRPHVPFRNSRLTFLLQDSLQGDGKTLMMVQVSPVPADAGESLCSLKFAQRVRSVELNASKRPDSRSASSSPTPQSLEED